MMLLKDTSTNTYRATPAMVQRYGRTLALLGYDIRALRTAEEWKAALDAAFAHQMHEFANQLRGKVPELDAILKGLPGWD